MTVDKDLIKGTGFKQIKFQVEYIGDVEYLYDVSRFPSVDLEIQNEFAVQTADGPRYGVVFKDYSSHKPRSNPRILSVSDSMITGLNQDTHLVSLFDENNDVYRIESEILDGALKVITSSEFLQRLETRKDEIERKIAEDLINATGIKLDGYIHFIVLDGELASIALRALSDHKLPVIAIDRERRRIEKIYGIDFESLPDDLDEMFYNWVDTSYGSRKFFFNIDKTRWGIATIRSYSPSLIEEDNIKYFEHLQQLCREKYKELRGGNS